MPQEPRTGEAMHRIKYIEFWLYWLKGTDFQRNEFESDCIFSFQRFSKTKPANKSVPLKSLVNQNFKLAII
jgi:hypothetical protein